MSTLWESVPGLARVTEAYDLWYSGYVTQTGEQPALLMSMFLMKNKLIRPFSAFNPSRGMYGVVNVAHTAAAVTRTHCAAPNKDVLRPDPSDPCAHVSSSTSACSAAGPFHRITHTLLSTRLGTRAGTLTFLCSRSVTCRQAPGS